MSGNLFEGKKQKQNQERDKQDRNNKTNENVISKGVDEGNQKTKMESWKGKKNTKKKVFEERAFGGTEEQKLSPIAGHSFCVSQIVTPLSKTPTLQGKRRYLL